MARAHSIMEDGICRQSESEMRGRKQNSFKTKYGARPSNVGYC